MVRARRTWIAIAIFGAALALVPASAGAEWVDWVATSKFSFEYTDNVSDSPFQATELDDFSWEVNALFGRVYQITDRTRATVGAEISGAVFEQYDGLDRVQGGLRLALFHKLGLGDAPWVRLSGFGGYREVSQDQRSGPLGEVETTLGKRFTPRFDASLSHLFTVREGGKGPAALLMMGPMIGGGRNVFDQKYHQFTLQGNYLLLPELMFTAGYTFRHGDFAAFANCAPATVPAKADVKAVTLDGNFGGCLYRLEGNGQAAFVKLSYGITDHLSLDLGYRFNYMKADSLDYERHTPQLLLYFRY